MKRLIIGISGASGIIYGIRLLEILKEINDIESHVVVSKAAFITLSCETDRTLSDIKTLANFYHNINDIGASISSGSFKTDGMIIAPCSVNTMGCIANGITSNLLTRAADVTLKEKRKLVLMLRESPLHSIHIENALKLSRMGAIIAPPMPAFYPIPKSVDDIINHSVGRILDLFDIETTLVKRWKDCTGN